MAYQKHIIKRQLIELQIPSGLNSREIQNRVSRIYHDSIIPLIDRYLGEQSLPASADKIPFLELDLGRINVSDLEKLLPEKIEGELREKLSRSIGQTVPEPGPGKENDKTKGRFAPNNQSNIIKDRPAPGNEINKAKDPSALDLIVYFLQTGSFPWWAKEASIAILEKNFTDVFTKNASGLSKVLHELFRQDLVLKRFIYTFSDDALIRLTDSYLPGVETGRLYEALFDPAGTGHKSFREIFWSTLLKTGAGEPLMEQSLREKVYTSLEDAIMQGNETASLKLMQHNLEQIGVVTDVSIGLRSGFTGIEWAPVRIYLEEIKDILHISKKNDDGIIQRPERQQKIKEILAEVHRLLDVMTAGALNRRGAGLPRESEQVNEPAELVLNMLGEIKKQVARELQFRQKRAETSKPARTGAESKKLFDPFSDSEKIYVTNAGLVLLWPFLSRFFINIGLAGDNGFIDEQAAEKACVILQYLADGDVEDLFEAQLVLNKVLCGIELALPINTRLVDVNQEDREAGENFLQAVISNGPLWNGLSVTGFREAWLKREGALSIRDGNWLLQVGRETYDIIVDRLPWTIQVLRLPWMKNVMYVEWQRLSGR